MPRAARRSFVSRLLFVVGLVLLALGAQLAWPVYRTAMLLASGGCRYGAAAAVPSGVVWTAVAAGLSLALVGLLLSPRGMSKRALGVTAACAVPLFLLIAVTATHFTSLEEDLQMAAGPARSWVYSPSLAGFLFLAAGLGRWAFAALVLYAPAMVYALTGFVAHLNTLFRTV